MFQRNAMLLVLATSVVPAAQVFAGGMNPAMGPLIDAAVARALAKGEMAGCVVAVGRRDGIVFERAYGNRRVEPDVAPMTLDTVFDMASLTKPLATATSVMILVERGELRLQDKVADYIPDFAANGKDQVTIEQLMVHSAGLVPDTAVEDYRDGWASAKAKICELKPLTPPGTAFKYSDVGYILLGKIVEQVAGKPLNEFAKDEIYAKLGMSDTGYLPPAELRARAATTEKRDDQWLTGVVHDPRAALMGGVAGHAGLFSTSHDLARFAQMMLHNGRLGDVRILGAATVAEMTRPRDIGGDKRVSGLGHGQCVFAQSRRDHEPAGIRTWRVHRHVDVDRSGTKFVRDFSLESVASGRRRRGQQSRGADWDDRCGGD